MSAGQMPAECAAANENFPIAAPNGLHVDAGSIRAAACARGVDHELAARQNLWPPERHRLTRAIDRDVRHTACSAYAPQLPGSAERRDDRVVFAPARTEQVG